MFFDKSLHMLWPFDRIAPTKVGASTMFKGGPVAITHRVQLSAQVLSSLSFRCLTVGYLAFASCSATCRSTVAVQDRAKHSPALASQAPSG